MQEGWHHTTGSSSLGSTYKLYDLDSALLFGLQLSYLGNGLTGSSVGLRIMPGMLSETLLQVQSTGSAQYVASVVCMAVGVIRGVIRDTSCSQALVGQCFLDSMWQVKSRDECLPMRSVSLPDRASLCSERPEVSP